MKYKTPRNFIRDYDVYYTPPDDVLKAIGKIAVNCASIEDILHSIHWRYLEIPFDVGPILTADLKPSRLMDDIIKIAVEFGEDEDRVQDLKALFADYRELSEQRNKCMHWLWAQPVKKSRRHRLYPPNYKRGKLDVHFDIKELNRLADDLVWVEARMRTHALTDDEFEQERKLSGRYKHGLVPAPWLDKRPRPTPKQSRPPANQKQPKRPPQS